MKWFSSIFGKSRNPGHKRKEQIFLLNTLSGEKELFLPLKSGIATLYSCGPTVYGPAHVGNLRSFIFSDTLARMLIATGYRVKRVMNITDVGHLVGDSDEGEDKMTLGAKREGSTPIVIAERFTKLFLKNLEDLAVDTSDIAFPRATDYIKEQVALAKTLEEKGFAYLLPDGLYFDTSRFPSYGKLGNLSNAQLKEGARVTPTAGKRNAHDFVLWRLAKPYDLQQWESPWGPGNPGWHLECSAMIRSLLGQEIDIHTGGEDHIHIHHNNEIAQSEAASGRTFVHYWMHNAFLTMGGEKASKATGNVAYLSDVVEKGFHPLALRYFFLQAHYRTPLSFSWDALASAANGLERLWKLAREVGEESNKTGSASNVREQFRAVMRDDIATPQALGVLWDALQSEDCTPREKWGLLEEAEAQLSLSLLAPPALKEVVETSVPEDIQKLLTLRESARQGKDFSEADRLRKEIENRGYHVDDSPHGPVLTRTTL